MDPHKYAAALSQSVFSKADELLPYLEEDDRGNLKLLVDMCHSQQIEEPVLNEWIEDKKRSLSAPAPLEGPLPHHIPLTPPRVPESLGHPPAGALRNALLVFDGSYVLSHINSMGLEMDYKKLVSYLGECFGLNFSSNKFWYDSLRGNHTDGEKRKFYRTLSEGFPQGPGIQTTGCGEHRMKEKPGFTEDGIRARVKVQKGVDVSIATRLLVHAHYQPGNPDYIDAIVLVAGDGDFSECLAHIRRVLHKEVFIVGFSDRSINTQLQELSSRVVMLDQPEHLIHFGWSASPQNAPQRRLPPTLPPSSAATQPPPPLMDMDTMPSIEKILACQPADPETATAKLLLTSAVPSAFPSLKQNSSFDLNRVCKPFWCGLECSEQCRADKSMMHLWAPNTGGASRECGRICTKFLQSSSCDFDGCKLLHVLKEEIHSGSMNARARPAHAPQLAPVACIAHVANRCPLGANVCPFVHVEWSTVAKRVRDVFEKHSKAVKAQLESIRKPIVPLTIDTLDLCPQFWFGMQCEAGDDCKLAHAAIQVPGQGYVVGRLCKLHEDTMGASTCANSLTGCPFVHCPAMAKAIEPTKAIDNFLCSSFSRVPNNSCENRSNCPCVHLNVSKLGEFREKKEKEKEKAKKTRPVPSSPVAAVSQAADMPASSAVSQAAPSQGILPLPHLPVLAVHQPAAKPAVPPPPPPPPMLADPFGDPFADFILPPARPNAPTVLEEAPAAPVPLDIDALLSKAAPIAEAPPSWSQYHYFEDEDVYGYPSSSSASASGSSSPVNRSLNASPVRQARQPQPEQFLDFEYDEDEV